MKGRCKMPKTGNEVTIYLADESKMDVLANILNEGFFNDPVVNFLVDNLTDRKKIMNDFFRLYLAIGFEKGSVYIAEISEMGAVGVAIWCPTDYFDANAEKALEGFAGAYLDNFNALGHKYGRCAPPEIANLLPLALQKTDELL